MTFTIRKNAKTDADSLCVQESRMKAIASVRASPIILD